MLTFAVQVLSCWRCQGNSVPVMGATEADPWVCDGQQWWVPQQWKGDNNYRLQVKRRGFLII